MNDLPPTGAPDLFGAPPTGPRPFLDPRPGSSGRPQFDPAPVPMPLGAPRPGAGTARLVVVTGPAGPLGRAVRAELGARGLLVAGVGGGPAVPAGEGAAVLELDGDLAAAEQVDRAAEFVVRVGEPVVGMVHLVAPGGAAAARSGDDVLDRLDDEYLRSLRGPYQLTRRLLPSLGATAGRVVVVHPDPLPGGAPSLPESMRAELDGHGVALCALAVSSAPTPDPAAGVRALAALVADAVVGAGGVELTAVRARLR